MADRKSPPAKKTAKKPNSVKTVKTAPRQEPERREPSFVPQFLPYVLVVFAVLIAVCMFTGAGVVGAKIKEILLGLNGPFAYALFAIIIFQAIKLSSDIRHGNVAMRTVSATVTYLFTSALVHVFTVSDFNLSVSELYTFAQENRGGGVIGGGLGSVMLRWFGKPGALVIIFAVLIVSVLLLVGFTPRAFIGWVRDSARRGAEKREKAREERELNGENFAEEIKRTERERRERRRIAEKRERRERRERIPRMEKRGREPVRFRYRRKRPFTPDIPLDDDYPADKTSGEPTEEMIFEEAMEKTKKRRLASGGEYETPAAIKTGRKTQTDEHKDGEPSDEEKKNLRVKRETVSKPDESAPKYVFPTIDILPEDTGRRDPGVKEELRENGEKLVETLRSFNVKTRIEDISRGPTITRYELLPEPGTRVRSIVNLVDDISLNLATTGVRIEAPVPGKSVVGIEVPNKNKSVVHLRTLLESSQFTENPSKLFCALGEDVAGEAVYLDIGKMPHLLVAGATGMGKSVCINSLIVSLLYKATPDEVKLILIDPKKVEFNIYNGVPHLLVPVVSDPKKAAGSLSWAVSEMERRFGLIEAVGVRDIASFNKVTKNDPEYEYMPYIVIIIDELADLMMTAPDNVEDSICRLMQKARAAGMHVIIGTQRPSVDVITGLIKANIPSRIACTVASQVDSRTILDRAGAENLIGRGDMLYLPVSASKPIRVQGAFVHETDVEKVVNFIKEKNSEDASYSKDVIDKIEEAAKNMGVKKKGAAASFEGDSSDEDEDPMLRDAVELAVTTGKISTSLIQRKLSLGYGRAAKLIDRMQELGFVSEPQGQKPREVLITREQFMEMVMRDGEGSGSAEDEEPEDGEEYESVFSGDDNPENGVEE